MEKKNKKMSLEEILEVMLKDRRVRLSIVKKIHKFFFYFYFPHYTELEIAPFHDEMFRITQNTDIRNAVIVGFRGCGKSTIFATSFPLWAILGEQKIKFILILSQTQQKAQTILQEIKHELETNELLKDDLGPFREERNQWNVSSLYLLRYDAKITIASTDQSIRGIRHKQYRPQLIIGDDLEDMDSVKTKEGRDKIHNWLMGEVMPAGDKHTRLMIIGSLLHQDSLIKRLQKNIDNGNMSGIFRAFPLLDGKGISTWPGKFLDQKAINEEMAKGFTESAWRREYLLEIISDEEPVIQKEWIKYYDLMPKLTEEYYIGTFIGIDPAGSDNEKANCTAMVAASVFKNKDDLEIFIHPNPINKRLRFNEIRDEAMLLSKTIGNGYPATLVAEDVGVQKWLIQEFEFAGVPVEAFKIGGVDKRSRLTIAAALVQAGKVFFPDKGAEDLLQQLLGFGVEKYDDLADAFSLLILKIMEIKNQPEPRVTII